MPGSRGRNRGTATPQRVADWQARAFRSRRESRQRAESKLHEQLPIDPLEDPERARRVGSGEE
jgi:hypothetical protein